MDVSVVGAGKVGTAFAAALQGAGHKIVAVSGRAETASRAARYLPGVPVTSSLEAAKRASVVIVAVPDDALAVAVASIAEQGGFRGGGWVIHVSGAMGLDGLDPAAAAGAHRVGIHPLQTFPSVEKARGRLRGAAMAVTADDDAALTWGKRFASDMGGAPFELEDASRPLYHAAAVFASNYVVAVSSLAASLFEQAGVPLPATAMAPLQEATLENIRELGPALALTGPAVRGDVTTIERNLSALRASAPDAVAPYLALCRTAVQLGRGSGRLETAAADAVMEVLESWS